MPVPSAVAPPEAPAVQVPSHLPLQLPEHLPEHEPVQATSAEPEAVQLPLHSTLKVPPVHIGGLALMSHSALTSHEAWQLACAVIDAVHFGSLKLTVALPPNLPLAPKFALI